MKKKIALILTACLMLSACTGNAEPNQGAGGITDSTVSNIDDYDIVVKPSQPTVPIVEEIPVSKLEYEFVTNGYYGSGIKINAVNSVAADIRFPETIGGEPVVYIRLEYSENVKTLIYPDSVVDYGVIPKSVEYVKLPAAAKIAYLRGCSNLKSVYIPDGVISVDFGDCVSLTSVALPDSVTSIGEKAFFKCTSLENVTIGKNVKSIGSSAFSDCTSLTSITIPDSVTSIGDDAFHGCDSLTSITIPDSVTSIGDDAFHGCDSLTSITIPDSVTSIGSMAFYGCKSLTSVTLPDSVTFIENAFYYCKSIKATYKGKTYTYDNIYDLYDAING